MNANLTISHSTKQIKNNRRPSEQFASPRVILYARKSTDSEDKQIQSLDDQIRIGNEYARREGLTVTDTIVESRSAKEPNKRRGFSELVRRVESGEADGILTWHPDRLARNAVDGGWIIDLLDRGLLRHLVFTGAYNFDDTPEGKFMLGMIFSQSKYYVDKLSKDVSRGMQSKREKGVYPHRAPEGYRNDPATRTIEIDNERFPVLRQAFELILSGTTTPGRVWEILCDDWGYRSRQTAKQGGGKFARSAFYKMLSNPFYYGVALLHESFYGHGCE